MSVPLLATKLYVPSLRAERVARPHLVARLKAGLEQRLTLVSAPAGFGKTTLLAECVLECRLPVAWLSLDSADNDPARFWTYLAAAMQTIRDLQEAGVGQAAVRMLASSGLTNPIPAIEGLLAGLINELADVALPFVLVLDDLHLIVDPQIHTGLSFLLDYMPPPPHGIRLVVATRADPPWPLARLRARGQITELRAADLRFTPEETAAFLNGVMGLDLPAAALSALDSRTEGWIAGLQMAALSMQGYRRGQDTRALAQFVEAFAGSHRFVLDYLLEEVLSQQTAQAQDFLLKTSILERMSAAVCDAVWAGGAEQPASEQADGAEVHDLAGGLSQRILEQLEAANLFIVALDEERRWYRYHHLFADLLLHRLQQSQAGLVPVLHLRASAWFERHGMIAEAVGHALAANAIERVASLVEDHTLLTIFHGRLATVLRWLSDLPEEVMRRRPWLLIGRAWALASAGQWDAVEPLLAAAEALIMHGCAVDEAQSRRLMGHVVVLRAYAAGIHGRLVQARELALLGLELVPRTDVAVYSFAANILGAALRHSGELAQAARLWTEAAAASRAVGDVTTELPLLNALASLWLEMGRLRAVESTSQEAFQRAAQAVECGEQQLPLLAPIHTRLSALLREWNDPAAALWHAREGVRLSEAWGHAEAIATAYSRLAFALQATGDPAAASRAMQRARQVSTSLSGWYNALAAAEQAELWLLQGNLEAAVRWSEESGLLSEDELDFARVPARIVLARVLLIDDRPGDALALLRRLLAAVQAAGAAGWAIQILILEALALQAQGQEAEAIPVLAQALFLAEPESYTGTFLNAGPGVQPLLVRLRSWVEGPGAGRRFQHLGGYIDRLLAALGPPTAEATRAQEIAGGDTHVAKLLEPLSDRELEVLRLLGTGLSTREIADELIVAVSTVRSHMKSIYGKLDAHGRMEAVCRARDFGLL